MAAIHLKQTDPDTAAAVPANYTALFAGDDDKVYLRTELGSPSPLLTSADAVQTPVSVGATGDGVADDTASVTAVVDARTYATTFTDRPIGVPGDILLTTPSRRSSPRIEGRVLTPPTGLGWTPPILPVFSGGKWRGNVSALSLFPAVDGATYYVDQATGNNANAGTLASPLRSINAALSKSDVGLVLVAGANNVSTNETWGDPTITTSAAHVIIRNWNKSMHRPLSINAWSHAPANWTVHGSFANVWTTTRTSVTGVWDSSSGLFAEPIPYHLVSSASEVNTTPGSYFIDTGNLLCVRPLNSGAPGANIKVLIGSTSVNWNSNKNLYVQGLDCFGGAAGFVIPNNTCDVVLVDCRVAGATGNGFSLRTQGTQVLENCEALMNGTDAFNYSKPSSFAAGKVVEVNCRTRRTGTSTGANQCSSIHSGIKIVRYGCEHSGSGSQVIADVDASTVAWNVGISLGHSLADASGNVAVSLSGSSGWFYDCDLGHGVTQIAASSNAVAYLHNTEARRVTTASGATIQSYRQG